MSNELLNIFECGGQNWFDMVALADGKPYPEDALSKGFWIRFNASKSDQVNGLAFIGKDGIIPIDADLLDKLRNQNHSSFQKIIREHLSDQDYENVESARKEREGKYRESKKPEPKPLGDAIQQITSQPLTVDTKDMKSSEVEYCMKSEKEERISESQAKEAVDEFQNLAKSLLSYCDNQILSTCNDQLLSKDKATTGTEYREQLALQTTKQESKIKELELTNLTPPPSSAVVPPAFSSLARRRLQKPQVAASILKHKKSKLYDLAREFLTEWNVRYPGTIDHHENTKGKTGADLRASNPKFASLADEFNSRSQDYVFEWYEQNKENLIRDVSLDAVADRFLSILHSTHSYYGSAIALSVVYSAVKNGPYPAAVRRHKFYQNSKEHWMFAAFLRELQRQDTSKPVFVICETFCLVVSDPPERWGTWADRLRAFEKCGFIKKDEKYIDPDFTGPRKPNYYWVQPVLDEDFKN